MIKRGLAQRIRALNAFVDDVYHAHEIVRAGIVPWSLIVSRPNFARPVHGVRPPGGVYCHVSGCDLVRGGDGRWRVLEDNVRTPSGISYVLENRVAMTRLMPELFAGHRVRAVEHYPSLLLDALRAAAPAGDGDPTVVVWTPGPLNRAYFEHAFLARQMGVELVEASDLVVRDAVCYMRTTAGLQRVHTIYRRLDDDFIDPLEFRADSALGVPGLVRAYREGTVAIANAIGTGVADDKAIYHYVPEMIRFYLERGADPRQRAHLSAQRREDAQAGAGAAGAAGRQADLGVRAARACSSARTHRRPARASEAADRADPERFIAQELVHLSTVPTETRRRDARAASRRSPAIRGVRRGDPDRSRRPHARRAPARVDDRQLVRRRRLEGHVGARRRWGRRDRGHVDTARAPAAAAAGRALRRLARAGAATTTAAPSQNAGLENPRNNSCSPG